MKNKMFFSIGLAALLLLLAFTGCNQGTTSTSLLGSGGGLDNWKAVSSLYKDYFDFSSGELQGINVGCAVAYGNGRFVIGAETSDESSGPLFLNSTDGGLTWVPAQDPGQIQKESHTPAAWVLNWVETIGYGNGTFVAWVSGLGRVLTSTDGITWTEKRAASGKYGGSDNIVYGNGIFFANRPTPLSIKSYFLSKDNGESWDSTWANEDDPDFAGITRSTYGNGTFYGLSHCESNDTPDDLGYKVFTSADAETWSPVTAEESQYLGDTIVYGDGTLIAAKVEQTDPNNIYYLGPRTIVYSGDGGATWQDSDMEFTLGDEIVSMAYGNGCFVVVGENNSISKIWYSTDMGKTWQAVNEQFDGYINSIAYGDGAFIAVSENGMVYRASVK